MAVLFAAAILEAGGDALMRGSAHGTAISRRVLFGIAGALVLAGYGWVVNAPPWDFGRLLGVYVAFFFVVAQGIAWIAFGQKPGSAILIGGGLIVAGGLVVSLGR